jgi:ankyrin repeat protein/CHAT domain-containing protein
MVTTRYLVLFVATLLSGYFAVPCNASLPQSQEQALFDAINTADLSRIQQLIERGVNPNAKDSNGQTALMSAIVKKRFAIFQLLLDKKADPNLVSRVRSDEDWEESSPLSYAAKSGLTDYVKALLAAKANPNITNVYGYTAMFEAARQGQSEIIKILLENGANPNIKTKNGGSPLLEVSSRGNVDLVKPLLNNGADPNVSEEYQPWPDLPTGKTPLMYLAQNGEVDAVELLLKKGANPNAKTKAGMTALLYAVKGNSIQTVKENQIKVVELLLGKGADVNAHVEADTTDREVTDLTGLMIGATSLNVPLVTLLLEKGADPNIKSKEGMTALMIAAGNESAARSQDGIEIALVTPPKDPKPKACLICDEQKIVTALLEKNADVNAKNRTGFTALMFAATESTPAIVKLLLQHGAQIDTQADDRTTALLAAAKSAKADNVKLLLDEGAKLDQNSPKSYLSQVVETSVFPEKSESKAKIIQMFIERGANANEQAGEEGTLLSRVLVADRGKPESLKVLLSNGVAPGEGQLLYATDHNYPMVAKLLLEHGAAVNVTNSDGLTPLMIAASNNYSEIVSYLLDKGASIDVQDQHGLTALMQAAKNGSEDSVQLLLNKKANPNLRDKEGNTALLLAAEQEATAFTSILEELIASGARVNESNNAGMTALMVASQSARPINVEVLLNKGAMPNLRSNTGDTALRIAVTSRTSESDEFNRVRVVKLLLDRSRDLNVRDREQKTLLILALEANNSAVAKELLARGINTRAKDVRGKTALDIARDRGQEEISSLLDKKPKQARSSPPDTARSNRSTTPSPASNLQEPPPEFWNQFYVPSEESEFKVLWPETNPLRRSRIQSFLTDLTRLGFGATRAKRNPKEFWAQLPIDRRQQLMRKYASVFRAYSPPPDPELVRLMLTETKQLSLGVSRDSEDENNTEEDRETSPLLKELDESLKKFAELEPLMFQALLDKGIGMDADTVNRELANFFGGFVTRTANDLIAIQKEREAWNLVEQARAMPFLLLQEQRPLLFKPSERALRHELAQLNLNMLRAQEDLVRAIVDFKAQGGAVSETEETDENETPVNEQSAVSKIPLYKKLAERVKALMLERIGLLGQLTDGFVPNGEPRQLPKSLTIEEASKNLPPGMVSVVFASAGTRIASNRRSANRMYVFVLWRDESSSDPNSRTHLLVRPAAIPSSELSDMVVAFRSEVTDPRRSVENTTRKGRELFQKLFPEELRPGIIGAKRLLISPDGPLWDLPFAALVTNDSGAPRYLGLESSLTYAPSLTQFITQRTSTQREQTNEAYAVVLGGAEFNRRSWRSAGPFTFDSAPENLPGSRDEAEGVAQTYFGSRASANETKQNGVLLLGEAANEAELRRWIGQADVVHLATHGYVDTARQMTMNSGIWLTPPLVKPPAGYTSNDGALQAAEIFNQLNLKADLVVISACEMGRGQNIEGAGVADMIWALQVAGARAVLASQWRIADQPTAPFMVNFHGRLRQGISKDEALRQTMRAAQAERATSHPYYWAPFILNGDPENHNFRAANATIRTH